MILKRIKIETMVGNATNCYIVADEEQKEAMVIDPAGECDRIMEMLDILGMKLKYIFLTHCHGDHIRSFRRIERKDRGKDINSQNRK